MKAANEPAGDDEMRAAFMPSMAPEITMPATTAAVAVPKPLSARKLAKEKLITSISSLYSPNAKVFMH